jgi:hypothetical protein
MSETSAVLRLEAATPARMSPTVDVPRRASSKTSAVTSAAPAKPASGNASDQAPAQPQ